jgi:hypothetical protein
MSLRKEVYLAKFGCCQVLSIRSSRKNVRWFNCLLTETKSGSEVRSIFRTIVIKDSIISRWQYSEDIYTPRPLLLSRKSIYSSVIRESSNEAFTHPVNLNVHYHSFSFGGSCPAVWTMRWFLWTISLPWKFQVLVHKPMYVTTDSHRLY